MAQPLKPTPSPLPEPQPASTPAPPAEPIASDEPLCMTLMLQEADESLEGAENLRRYLQSRADCSDAK